MPFVKVWIDEEPCNGTCESADKAERLEAKIDEAEKHLRSGDHEAALAALVDAPSAIMKTPADILRQYKKWKHGHLPGFANYKHPQQHGERHE